jgi:hypothetical protein
VTDSTPEEIAYEWGIRNGWDLKTEADLAETIRAAVAVEKEACAVKCETSGMVNGHYYAAAIRAR